MYPFGSERMGKWNSYFLPWNIIQKHDYSVGRVGRGASRDRIETTAGALTAMIWWSSQIRPADQRAVGSPAVAVALVSNERYTRV
jgi:hypothetical protein